MLLRLELSSSQIRQALPGPAVAGPVLDLPALQSCCRGPALADALLLVGSFTGRD